MMIRGETAYPVMNHCQCRDADQKNLMN